MRKFTQPPSLRRIVALSAGAASVLLLTVAGATQAATPHRVSHRDSPTLVWSDEFSGSAGSAPNKHNWTYDLGGDGWGNNELECYTSSRTNSALDGAGDLVISAVKAPGTTCADGSTNDYTSARLTTDGKFSLKYGHIEMRAKLPKGSGTWPAFWALGTNIDDVGWPNSGEIDTLETVGTAPSDINATIWGNPVSGDDPVQVTNDIDTKLDLSAAFHTYSADWTSTQVSFAIDGNTYAVLTKKAMIAAGGHWVLNHQFYLLLNLAIGGDWPGDPNSSATWPQKYTIDYVRVYQ